MSRVGGLTLAVALALGCQTAPVDGAWSDASSAPDSSMDSGAQEAQDTGHAADATTPRDAAARVDATATPRDAGGVLDAAAVLDASAPTPDAADGRCLSPNPQGCMRDVDCGHGFTCDRTVCAPSQCECTDENQWGCTRDCSGGRCVASGALCNGVAAPSGCTQYGCPAGQRCVRQEGGCSPSRCSCSEGGWMCTRDCAGGGTCMP